MQYPLRRNLGGYMSERHIGTIHQWYRTFGYIYESDTQRYFFHVSQFASRQPVVGETVSFEIPEQPVPAFGKLLTAHNVMPHQPCTAVAASTPEAGDKAVQS